jgi:hypothetical protein
MKLYFSALELLVLGQNPAILDRVMKLKSRSPEQDDPLRPRLTEMRNELVKLAALIDRLFFETEWAEFFPSHTGRPATAARLVPARAKALVFPDGVIRPTHNFTGMHAGA